MSAQNNNPKGIVFILIAMIVFSVQDGIMKHVYNFVLRSNKRIERNVLIIPVYSIKFF